MSALDGPRAHSNNFGLLRLLLAYAVIISHAPQMLDGNFSREPLVSLGSQITLGTLAVDGFFIISGYLIASSYLSNPSLKHFLRNRVLRIYPAFVLACLICVFLVAPLSGGSLALHARDWAFASVKTLFLFPPEVPGSFHSLAIPALDGSMWTIRNEFRCYLLVALLGAVGILTRRRINLALTAALYAAAVAALLAHVKIPSGPEHQIIFALVGDPNVAFMLTAVFMSGVCLRLYRDKITFRAEALALSAVVFGWALLKSPLVEVAAGIFGAYMLLWFATKVKSKAFQAINNRYDYSYGTYLYAWPIASLIVLACHNRLEISPTELSLVTVLLATVAGAISWYVLEKPVMGIWRTGRNERLPSAESAELAAFNGSAKEELA